MANLPRTTTNWRNVQGFTVASGFTLNTPSNIGTIILTSSANVTGINTITLPVNAHPGDEVTYITQYPISGLTFVSGPESFFALGLSAPTSLAVGARVSFTKRFNTWFLSGNGATGSGGGGGGGGTTYSAGTGINLSGTTFSLITGTTAGLAYDGAAGQANAAALAILTNNNTVRRITGSVTADPVATTTQGIVAWASTSTAAKSSTLGAGSAGYQTIFKDEKGNAATGNIVITASGCTIDNASSFTLNANYQSATFAWDNVSNWMVI